MAVTAAEFTLSGGGRLNPAWFLPDDVTLLLNTWIGLESGPDELVTARVYYRAFTFLADRAMSGPSLQKDRTKTSQWSDGQLAWWAREAQRYLDEADLLTGNVFGPVITPWEGKDEHDRFC